MKKGFFGVLVVFLLLLSSLSYGVVNSNTLDGFSGSNLARIFDFDNDGRYELLAFSDKIDSTPMPIDYYDVSVTTFIKSLNPLGIDLERCSLGYQDYDLDGNIDIFYSCFNSSNDTSLISNLYSYNGTDFENQNVVFNYDSLNLTKNTYGDTLFFDFDGDSKADVLSCFLTSNGNITLFNGSSDFSTNVSSGIALDDFLNLSELITDLKNFKFSEDDIRVALMNIKPKNALDEEIMKYL